MLADWQERLLLSHWDIIARVVGPDEMERLAGDGNAIGLCEDDAEYGRATIFLLETKEASSDENLGRIEIEQTIVHELLHLVIPMPNRAVEAAVETAAMERAIEHCAKAIYRLAGISGQHGRKRS